MTQFYSKPDKPKPDKRARVSEMKWLALDVVTARAQTRPAAG